jgi:hypothetical protein
MVFNGHLGGGLAVGGTVQFICDYAPEAITSGDAEFRWLEPGNDSPSVQVLGTYLTPVSGQLFTISSLPAGTIFGFYLSTDTSAGKVSATLTITGFQFLDVPEPSTGALVAGMLVFLGAARWRRARIQALGLCQASSTH